MDPSYVSSWGSLNIWLLNLIDPYPAFYKCYIDDRIGITNMAEKIVTVSLTLWGSLIQASLLPHSSLWLWRTFSASPLLSFLQVSQNQYATNLLAQNYLLYSSYFCSCKDYLPSHNFFNHVAYVARSLAFVIIWFLQQQSYPEDVLMFLLNNISCIIHQAVHAAKPSCRSNRVKFVLTSPQFVSCLHINFSSSLNLIHVYSLLNLLVAHRWDKKDLLIRSHFR